LLRDLKKILIFNSKKGSREIIEASLLKLRHIKLFKSFGINGKLYNKLTKEENKAEFLLKLADTLESGPKLRMVSNKSNFRRQRANF
jgi:hypothetical protein